MKSLRAFILEAKSAQNVEDVLFRVCTLDRDENNVDERAVKFEKILKDEIKNFVKDNKDSKFELYVNNNLKKKELEFLQKIAKENSDILIYNPRIYFDGDDMIDKVTKDVGVKQLPKRYEDQYSKIYRWDDGLYVNGYYCQICFYAEDWH